MAAEKTSSPNLAIKLLLACSFVLTFCALLVLALSPPLNHYELSIYAALPLFWPLILASSSVTIAALIYQAYTKGYRFFYASFFLIILNTFVILSLPTFRTYYLHGSTDVAVQLSFLQKILADGSIGNNYYPATHILGAAAVQICAIPPELSLKLLPAIFSVVFILFTFFLACAVSNKREFGLIAVAASATIIYSYYQTAAYPQAIATSLFPLTFFLYFRAQEQRELGYIITFLPLLVLIPYTHPVVAVALVVSLIFAEAARFSLKKRDLGEQGRITLGPALMAFVSFFIWGASFSLFGYQLLKLKNWFVGAAKDVPRTAEITPVFEMGRDAWIALDLKMYGAQVLLLALALVAVVLVTGAVARKKAEGVQRLFVLSSIFAGCLLTYFVLFYTVKVISFGRFLSANLGLWCVPVLAVFTLSRVMNARKVGVVIVVAILTVSCVVSTISVYRSPLILQPNWQQTYEDAAMRDWLGIHDNGQRTMVVATIALGNRMPLAHFGYDNYTSLGNAVFVNTTLPINTFRQELAIKDPVIVTSPLTDIWVAPDINQQDLSRLHSDKTVNWVYANGEADLYLVNKAT